jgi:hypothetical protein
VRFESLFSMSDVASSVSVDQPNWSPSPGSVLSEILLCLMSVQQAKVVLLSGALQVPVQYVRCCLFIVC